MCIGVFGAVYVPVSLTDADEVGYAGQEPVC